MKFDGFILSDATQEAIAELIRLDEVAAEFAGAESEAKEALRKVQAARVDGLVKVEGASSAGADRTVEIKAASERILDAQSAQEACRAKRAELLGQIQAKLKADKVVRAAELGAECGELVRKNAKLKREFILALAAATVKQMQYLGYQERLKKTGPFIKTTSDLDAQKLFESEIERLWAEVRLEEHGPYSDRIKLANDHAASYRGPISAEDLQTAIEAVRKTRAKG